MTTHTHEIGTASVQVRTAREAAIKSGSAKLAEAATLLESVRDNQIAAMNSLRDAGIQFNVASGREQLFFNADGMAFARKEILPHLPPNTTLNHVKLCVHIASICPEPIKSVTEMKVARREVQSMLLLFGVAEEPRRETPQEHHTKNMMATVINSLCRLRREIVELNQTSPYTEWRQVELDSFVEAAEPVFQFLQRARQKRLGLPQSKAIEI